jgi:hypothetical protein
VPASSLAPTLHGGKPRSLRREGIVWPGIHHSLDKRNSKRAAPCRPRPSHAGHWTATYSCSLQSSTPQGPLTAVYLSMYLYRCHACLLSCPSRLVPSHLARARGRGRCPARVRIQSNARDSEVRVSLQIGNVEELQPRLDAFLTATAESIQPFPSLHVYNAAQGDTGSEMGLVGTDNHLCHLTTV